MQTHCDTNVAPWVSAEEALPVPISLPVAVSVVDRGRTRVTLPGPPLRFDANRTALDLYIEPSPVNSTHSMDRKRRGASLFRSNPKRMERTKRHQTCSFARFRLEPWNTFQSPGPSGFPVLFIPDAKSRHMNVIDFSSGVFSVSSINRAANPLPWDVARLDPFAQAAYRRVERVPFFSEERAKTVGQLLTEFGIVECIIGKFQEKSLDQGFGMRKGIRNPARGPVANSEPDSSVENHRD